MTDRYASCEQRSLSSLGDYSTKSRKKQCADALLKSILKTKLSCFLGGLLRDKHVTPIAMVFDELKDYLSESDLSLDYKIARSRRNKKKKVYRNSKLLQNTDDTQLYQRYQGK